MTRVLHVAQPVDAGVARCVATFAADQVARGLEVTVACPDGGHLADDLARAGVRRVRWEASRAPGPSSLSETRALAAVVTAVGPDVLHLHSAKAGLAGRLAVRGRVPTLFQPHGWSWLAVTGPVRLASRRFEVLAARWADAIVCVSEGEARLGREAGVGGRLEVVRNGVDLDAHPEVLERPRDGLGEPAGPLVVCVGRLARQKGQDVLLAAWPGVLARVPGARLVLVGDGPDRADLEATAAGLDGVRLVGASSEAARWYAAADVVVLPSRWEGMALTPMEAMATGRPVVVTDIAGAAEVVAPGTGAVVPPEDPSALAAALASRLADPVAAAAEGRAAARHARAELGLGHTLDRLAALTADIARRG